MDKSNDVSQHCQQTWYSLCRGINQLRPAPIAVGRTSTFAWYTATQTASVTASSSAYGLNTAQSTVSISAVSITITLSSEDTVQLSYYDSSADKVYYGAYADEVVEKEWDGNNSTRKLVGEFTATAAFVGTPSASQLDALKGHSYTFNVSAQGNVIFVGDNAKDPATAIVPTVTVSFKAADGDINTVNVTNGKYAIRTNNHGGPEFVSTTEAADSNNPGYQHAYNTGMTANDHYHSDDKIVVASQTVDHD